LFRHLWSLAVEEQFYLLWPIACGLGMSLLGRRRLMLAVVGGVVVSAALMALLFDPANANRAFYGTDTRAMALLAGVLLSFAWHPNTLKQKTGRFAPVLLDAVGAFALFM